MRAIKPMRIGAGPVVRGACFRVLPVVALQMLREGAAVLVDEDDLPALRAAALEASNDAPRAPQAPLH